MRLFKNRGDIYVPRTKFKSDIEQKVLLSLLSFIVIFTIVFVTFFAFKYDFSIKKFFKPENIEVVETVEDEILPEVSGKQNFLFIMHNSQTNEMYFSSIIQVDMDAVSYKICTLASDIDLEGKTAEEIYSSSGAAGLLKSFNEYFGISIDYYIDENVENYSDMFDSMGKVNFIVNEDIRYKDTSRYGFNIKIKSGEQNFDGDKMSKIIRYYTVKEKNYSAVNDILLQSLSQQLNKENYEKRERLFSIFIEKSETNITVKNFKEGIDNLKVLSSETTGVNIYNVETEYESSSLNEQSAANIKAYFSK